MPVEVAQQDTDLKPDTCYIGEPAAHLVLISNLVAGLMPHVSRHRNRTIDLLFESLAKHAGASGIGVILSGSLDDGSRGLPAIHSNGGTMMARRTGPRGRSLEDEMPKNARKYNEPVDVIATVKEIAQSIQSAQPNRMTFMCPNCKYILQHPMSKGAHLAHPLNLSMVGVFDAFGRATCPVCLNSWRRGSGSIKAMVGSGNNGGCKRPAPRLSSGKRL